ncbi:MAG: outer membrane protein assembly factor BamA [Candidatus Omnitrophica bacterium]|nr:outer membrane protein assembly factor BamA [Candidatus Omnitrophota bacterium]
MMLNPANLKKFLGLLLFGSLCSLWATGAVSRAFAADEEQFVVTAVEVEGNKIVSSSTILAKIKTRPGDRIRQETVDEDIKRLYGLGFFTDVSAEVRPYRDGKLVRFHVKERPLVAGIVITGSRHFREAKLREDLKTKEQELLDRRQLKEDLERIKQLYRTKGFYLADISHEVKVNEATNQATVFITITEGRKIRVRQILFVGNQNISARRLRKGMATKQGSWFTAGYYRPEVLDEDVERIKGLYHLEGYSDCTAGASADFDEKKRWLIVTMTITEGPRYLVGETVFTGVEQINAEELRAKVKLRAGDPFSQERLSEDLGKVQSVYFAKGFMAASVEPSTALNPQTNKVDIAYRVTEGSVSYVGRILIRGNLKTRDVVIRRELRISPGERFDGEKLRRSKERLYNLGFFEEVTLETVPAPRPDQRDLVVAVKESKTGEFSFGGGFSSVDKLVGFAEITQRNFDLFNWPTFVGGGQELKFQVQAGTRRRNIEFSFTEPWAFNRPYLLGLDLFNRVRTRGEGYSFDLVRRGGDLRLGKSFGDYDRVDGMYRFEKAQVSDVPDTASAALRDELGANTISAVRLSYTRDTRDNVFVAKQGYFATSGIETAGSFLGGNRDFWKWTGDGSLFSHPLIENQVLEFHLSLGLTNSFGGSKTVPIFERFFAGGSDSIRGYRERRVGPRDRVNNDPVGGEAMALFTSEYTVPLVDFLKGAAFLDVGNVWDRVGKFGRGGYKAGVGGGLRIKTPFGPVKLDYGWPLSNIPGEHKTGRLHFSASRAF